MKHVIIGTAGHVDHGKTCLIKALTGTDTDRLQEEKKRGITIELGFACLDFQDGHRAGIVDVPGHEKFVKNMLAGAGGMDLAMLVVAADEGVMPQTVEHLDILSILGIAGGVVVITKTDLVEPDFLELVVDDVKKLVKGTFLENSPIVPVSASAGTGIEQLKMTLQSLCISLPERKDSGVFRMPIDRIFSLKGFGTIVTGTIWEGSIKKDQELVLYPENEPVRIRNLQVHSCDRQKAYAGERAAVNLPGKKKEEMKRGDILASPGSLYASDLADVKLTLLKHAERSVKSGSRVHIYTGTKELLGKVILADRPELLAGETCYAQLRLEEKTAVKKGDPFVIRFYSPAVTVGGGRILDPCARKHRKKDPETMRGYGIREKGTPAQQLELAVREQRGEFRTLKELSIRCGLSLSEIQNQAKRLETEGKVICVKDQIYIHKEEFESYRKKAVEALKLFHKKYPLKEGMGKEELRSRLNTGAPPAADDELIRLMISRNAVKERNGYYSNPGFHVVMEEDTSSMAGEITEFYRNRGFAPPVTESYLKEHAGSGKYRAVFHSLVNRKILIRLDEQYCIHNEYYRKGQEIFLYMEENCGTPVMLGAYRDELGSTRKIAVALLEHYDKTGFTRKTDGGRVAVSGQKHG